MNGAQITWLILNLIGLGVELAKHGEYKKDKHNFWVSLIALGIEVAILKWGGFF